MSRMVILLLAAGLVVAVLLVLLNLGGPGAVDETQKLVIYCAAGLRRRSRRWRSGTNPSTGSRSSSNSAVRTRC